MKWIALLVLFFLSIANEIPALNLYRQQEQARQENQGYTRLTMIATRFSVTQSITVSITPTPTRTARVGTATPTPTRTGTP